jgi:predicted  nucleic acid-binding Zn-ribbon protein
MRRLFPTLALALALTGPALAGPSVPRSLVEGLPADVFQATAPIETQVEDLRQARIAKRIELDRAKGDAKALKLELKAAKAQVKADKAERKAARKRGDNDAAAAAGARLDASQARVEDLEGRIDRAGALADLLKAQLAQIEAQLAFKEAEIQVVYAQAVSEHVEPYDDSKLRGARAKAELSFQRARTAVSVAETRFTALGGTELPDPMIPVEPPPAAPAAPNE